ncbi:MAG: hypothetical protein M1368_12230, partial [Thaumarchaeota archaeon]|nr:hypothetical protein [Nitrososphaerota archaeon]
GKKAAEKYCEPDASYEHSGELYGCAGVVQLSDSTTMKRPIIERCQISLWTRWLTALLSILY